MKGKRLPQLGRIEISIIEESQPRWLAFLSGELDYVNVPADLVANVLGAGEASSPNLAKQGRHAAPGDAAGAHLLRTST